MLYRRKPPWQRAQLVWAKAYLGLVGNERADEIAKRAVENREIQYHTIPMSWLKRQARINSEEQWQSRYETETSGSYTREHLPTIRDARKLRATTPMTFTLAQGLTGHGCDRAHLLRFKQVFDDKCVCDGHSRQDADHLITHCPMFTNQRRRLLGITDREGPIRAHKFLQDCDAIEQFARFINDVYEAARGMNGTPLRTAELVPSARNHVNSILRRTSRQVARTTTVGHGERRQLMSANR